jgi:ankyrin repeat protein
VRTTCSIFFVMSLAATAAAAPTETPSETVLRDSATRAMRVIDRTVATWHTQRTCFSCHHQSLPIAAALVARSRGIPLDETLLRKNVAVATTMIGSLARQVQGYQQIDPGTELGTLLSTAELVRLPRSASSMAAALTLASHQLDDGSWYTLDARPPQSYSPITTTAFAVRALAAYMPAERSAELAQRIARARAWLSAVKARDTEELTYRLYGLAWAHADKSAIDAAASALSARQRPDGGWAQISSRQSDAYSTGEALTALHEAAQVPTSDPRYARGLRFLIDHQDADGTWLVETRMHEQDIVSPPHFEANFGHGEHQIISCMGTTRAVMAIMDALPPVAPPPAALPAESAAAAEPGWVKVAMTGTVDALRALLDGGLDPNAVADGDTSVLMIVMPDFEKVRLLLDRGADVNRPAASGFTPLLVAMNHRHADAVGALLLERGAIVQPTSPKPAHGATPLIYAVWTGNLETIGRLRARSASITAKAQLGGLLAVSPMELAVFVHDVDVVKALAQAGADVNEVDETGISLLTGTVIANDLPMARALIALGARVDLVDDRGMTALMHAASVDFGDTGMVELLLGAGGNAAVKSKDGLTALDIAHKYRHDAMARVLSRGSAAN